MVTQAEYAEWVGRDEAALSETEFGNLLRKGTARLERALGYQLCPLTVEFCPLVAPLSAEEIAELPEVTIPYRYWQKTLEVPPFLELYSIRYTSCDGDDEELEECDYIVHKGDYFNNWAKTIELCKGKTCRNLCKSCIEVKVRAFWGLCCQTNEEDVVECCIPEELENVLLDFMSQNDPCDKSNIKSESALSHTYTKFDKVDLEKEYADVIFKYAISKPSQYPL